MFLRLVRARIQMAVHTARSAPRRQQGVIAALSVFGLGLAVLIAGACAALVLYAQNGISIAQGLTPAASALIGRIAEYLFFFLLAGSIPFVAATLFQADDLPLLLSTLISPRAIVGGKLLDAAGANAAQFVFLGVPVLVGVGWATGLNFGGWLCLALTTLLLLALPPATTALLLLAAARVLGLRRVRFVVVLVSILLGLAITTFAVLGASSVSRSGALDPARIGAVLHGASGTRMPDLPPDRSPRWLPSSWAAAVMRDSAGGQGLGQQGAEGLAALTGTTVVLVGLCLLLGERVLVSEAMLEPEGGADRRRGRVSWRLPGLSYNISGLLIKDGKYLARDLILMGQVGTALILFLVPFLLRATQGMRAGMDNELYGAVCLVMLGLIVYMVTSIVGLSSVGLEGRGFWLILASPVGRGQFLRAKWLGTFALSAGIVTVLTLVTWRAFGLSLPLTCEALAAFIMACLALSGLGVGLAGMFPRFIYENPAHRASVWALVLGFVLATGYLLVCGGIAGAAYAVVTLTRWTAGPVAIVAVGCFLLVSALTGWIPVRMAERRLRDFEWEG